MAWGSDTVAGGPVDVAKMLDNKAQDLLWEIAQLGALVSLSLTSDGGALLVSVTVDGETGREYFRDPETLIDWLTDSVDPIAKACETARASRAQRKRGRGLRSL